MRRRVRSYRPWFWVLFSVVVAGGGVLLVTQKVSLPDWRRVAGGETVAGTKTEVSVPLTSYQNDQFKFTLKYPEGFVVGRVAPEGQQKDPVLSRLVREEPPTVVRIWEESLGIANAFIKEPTLEYLKDQVDRQAKVIYPDFQKEKIEDSTFAGLPAFTVWFTFQDPEKVYREKIKETITTKDGRDYYFQCMAPVAMWEKAEPSCDLIHDNFQFLPPN